MVSPFWMWELVYWSKDHWFTSTAVCYKCVFMELLAWLYLVERRPVICSFMLMYEAYSESKYRFTVKKSTKVSYKILFLSDSKFFKLFFHIFAAIIEALIIVGHKFLYTLLLGCGHLQPKWLLTMSWSRVLEIWGKCRDRSEIVKRLSSRTLLLTLHTKSSFTKDGHPLRASSCTFSCPSLNIRTHFLTMPSLIALSPYTWQIWWWLSLGRTFLAFKKWITDRISQLAAPSIVLNMFNARNKHEHNTNFTKWHVWLLIW